MAETLTGVVGGGHGGEGQPLGQEARRGYRDDRRGEGLGHLSARRQSLGILSKQTQTLATEKRNSEVTWARLHTRDLLLQEM